MASKISFIILACVVVICTAEAPFRGYSNRVPQQQQSGPYPAAGFRPDRAFNLPSDEAVAQQLRLAQIIKQQQRLQQLQQQQQQRPSQFYGAPSNSEASPPQQPSGLYGAPQEDASSQQQPQQIRPPRPSQSYGSPQDDAASQQQPQQVRPLRPSQSYGTPQDDAASQQQSQFVRPQQPSQQYGAPQDTAASQRQVQVQRPQTPSRQYGPPREAPAPRPTSDSTSAESLEESREVETVAAVANAVDNKPGRLTQGERDTENDETETSKASVTAPPAGYVLVPITAAAGYTPQSLAYFQAPAAAQFAKLQFPTILGVQQAKLLAPQFLAPQNYYQPAAQQFAFAAPLQQAW